ncbi:MAG: fumarylacetoacetate hydrolase family protein [Gammaproteobacteria bacterium]|nr:fumarylacetoacetate hydrolase family protein [Gammaproteobacteria bacterium]
MKLATFLYKQKSLIGAVVYDQVVPFDLQGSLNMMQFLGGGPNQQKQLQEKIDSGKDRIDLADVKLQASIQRPGKFFGVGLNYADHIAETGLEKPEYPTFFNKQSTCVIGPGQAIHRPRVSEKLDYEGELGLVIGRRCRHVTRKQAKEVIAGYLVCNDVSVRDWQMRSHTWTLGKSFDTHGPIGPWIVTPDEIGDPHNLFIKTWVNADLRQSSNTKNLIFDCYYLVEYLSTVMTLEPGDIIATGTSSGVGVKMNPRGYMKPGDTVRVEIEKIGVLENPVIEEPDNTSIIE